MRIPTPEMTDAPTAATVEASMKFPDRVIKGDFTMDSSTSEEVQGYQAVVYAEWGWRDKVPSDDPARWETVVIGVYGTYQEAKDACVQALHDVIDYIGFCVKTTTQAAVAALAA